MPKFLGSFASLKYDTRRATKELNRELAEILRDSTKTWVRTVVRLVPTWSGMSQASISKIADLVDEPVFSSPKSGAPDRRAQGRALGSATLSDKGPEFFFTFETKVFHYIFNEFNDATQYGFRLIRPGPYHSMAKANKAFAQRANRRLRRLKFDFRNHIKVVRRVIK